MFQAAAPTFRCVKRLRKRNQKRRNALLHQFLADVCRMRRSASVRSDTVELRVSRTTGTV